MKYQLLNTNITSPKADMAMLFLRLAISLLMITHGYDKLQNFLNGSSDFPDPLHIGSRASLGLTVFAEFFCSILLILGLFSRIALYILIACMMIIVFSIHGNDPLNEKEHGLLFLIPYITILLAGVGRYSLDYLIFNKKKHYK